MRQIPSEIEVVIQNGHLVFDEIQRQLKGRRTVADAVFQLLRHLAEGLIVAVRLENRVVTEAVGTAGSIDDRPPDLPFKCLDHLTIDGDGDGADEAGPMRTPPESPAYCRFRSSKP